MSRWFRHYAGMMRDEKLVSVAVKSKQPVERVVWVWGAILESASEINDNGRYEFDAGEAAYFLRCDDADLVGILSSLESLGRLSGGLVVRWGDRQYSSDTAAERQRRYRERKSANAAVQRDDRDDKRNGDVTPTSRDALVTPQETETELEEDKPSLRSGKAPGKPTPRQHLETVLSPELAIAVIEHRHRLRKPLTERAAANLAGSLSKFPDPNAAADRMIEKGWLSIDPEWTGAQPRGSPSASLPKPASKADVISTLRESLRNGQPADRPNPGPDGHHVQLLSLPSRTG